MCLVGDFDSNVCIYGYASDSEQDLSILGKFNPHILGLWMPIQKSNMNIDIQLNANNNKQGLSSNFEISSLKPSKISFFSNLGKNNSFYNQDSFVRNIDKFIIKGHYAKQKGALDISVNADYSDIHSAIKLDEMGNIKGNLSLKASNIIWINSFIPALYLDIQKGKIERQF